MKAPTSRRVRYRLRFLLLAGFLGGWAGPIWGQAETSEASDERPNIVILLADDLGYADVGFSPHHQPEVHTPNIDALAASGVRFTNGYTSGNVCAPTRAGLLTGRYQQRFGFWQINATAAGLPASELTVADLLKREGYATGAFGKWHVGAEPHVHPLERGFDAFYGFLGHGAHDFWDLSPERGELYNAIYRDDEIIDDTGRGYLTDLLAEEAVSFIQRHQDEPFLLYLPFNAVHEPKQAREADLERFDTGDGSRDVLMAMLYRMDLAIGAVVEALKEVGVYENTLIFFLSDNGGPIRMHADNTPLRGNKHTFYEGGIRVPFVVSWPAQIEPGVRDQPVISLDILPTAVAAAGGTLPQDRVYDGENLLPLLKGETDAPVHERLFFDDHTDEWAVREGRWKLYSSELGEWDLYDNQGDLHLYDLENDIGEEHDLFEQHPDVARRLKGALKAWRKEMAPPLRPPIEEVVR